MNTYKKIILLISLLMSGVFLPSTLMAITSVTTLPPTSTVSYVGNNIQINFRWQITGVTSMMDPASGAQTFATVQSVRGQLLGPAGQLLNTVNTQLVDTDGATVTFLERITLRSSDINSVLTAGRAQLRYQRSFSDGQSRSGRLNIIVNDRRPTSPPPVVPPPDRFSLSVTPANTAVSATSVSSLNLKWKLKGLASNIKVTSSSGRLLDDAGRLLQRVNTVLSRSASRDGTVNFSERVSVPAKITFQQLQQNKNRLFYERTFVDGSGGNQTTRTQLAIRGDVAAALNITRIALQFDKGAVAQVLSESVPIHANVEIDYTGRGVMQGRWIVATPESTSGQPIFTTLKNITVQLSATGHIVLRSPKLPTRTGGTYIVRFEISRPDITINTPEIRYSVQQGDSFPSLFDLTILQPVDAVTYNHNVEFFWLAVDLADTYKIEFYTDLQGDNIVSGMLLDAIKQKTLLSNMVLSHLQSGKSYFWRVIAFDAGGVPIAVSQTRQLFFP